MQLAIWVLTILVLSFVGYQSGVSISYYFPGSSPINIVYMTLVGALLGVLLAPRVAYLVEQVLAWWRRIPPEVPLAVVFASVFALVAAVLLTTLLGQIPGFMWYHSLLLALVLIVLFSALTLRYRDHIQSALSRPDSGQTSEPEGGKLLDTSVLVDGRVHEVMRLGFLEGPVYIPDFVIRELRDLADSHNEGVRSRGRRGMATAEKVLALGGEVLESDLADEEVDDALVKLARKRGMSVVSNDVALLSLCSYHKVPGLSINALAEALRIPYLPGDRVRIRVEKPGKERGQGVGYLEDGTMVVIDGAAGDRGKEIEVVITQVYQTHMGKMLFAKKAQ